jgi:hypothetical protein
MHPGLFDRLEPLLSLFGKRGAEGAELFLGSQLCVLAYIFHPNPSLEPKFFSYP